MKNKYTTLIEDYYLYEIVKDSEGTKYINILCYYNRDSFFNEEDEIQDYKGFIETYTDSTMMLSEFISNLAEYKKGEGESCTGFSYVTDEVITKGYIDKKELGNVEYMLEIDKEALKILSGSRRYCKFEDLMINSDEGYYFSD